MLDLPREKLSHSSLLGTDVASGSNLLPWTFLLTSSLWATWLLFHKQIAPTIAWAWDSLIRLESTGKTRHSTLKVLTLRLTKLQALMEYQSRVWCKQPSSTRWMYECTWLFRKATHQKNWHWSGLPNDQKLHLEVVFTNRRTTCKGTSFA
jgi:hypothetical protein